MSKCTRPCVEPVTVRPSRVLDAMRRLPRLSDPAIVETAALLAMSGVRWGLEGNDLDADWKDEQEADHA